MASELGVNPKLAKRAGLLHDIGKVPDEETELSHALLGPNWLRNMVRLRRSERDRRPPRKMEMKYVISSIIQACDAISGARPGARREMDATVYPKRIKDLKPAPVKNWG